MKVSSFNNTRQFGLNHWNFLLVHFQVFFTREDVNFEAMQVWVCLCAAITTCLLPVAGHSNSVYDVFTQRDYQTEASDQVFISP